MLLISSQILQVLIFCAPFYNFLDQVRQRTVHSMKSATPLVDAMIMFMREFKVLASADSADVLRSLLSQPQLEQYGDPVIPQYVYDAIAKLDRFISMRVRQNNFPFVIQLLMVDSAVTNKTQKSSWDFYLKVCTMSASL